MPAAVRSVAVQLVVHVFGVRGCTAVGLVPCLPIGVVVAAAAFGARSMTRGKGDGLVEEEQMSVMIRLPLPGLTTLELKHAGDPGLALMAADNVAGAGAFMQSTTVARPRAATRNRDNVAARCDAVACGR